MAIFDIPWLSESIKKRALRYLLQRYLGNFLLQKLTLDQLSLDLYEGKGAIRHILLDVDTINDEFNHLSSFKFIDGSIGEMSVLIPWSSLLTDSSSIDFDGICLNLCRFVNNKCNDFNRESTYLTKSLMTSSMQIAEEIVNEEQEKFDGLEMFAQLIDSVLRRFKLSATNTSFKFVFPRKTGDGQEIEIRIKHMKCEEEEQLGDNDQNERNMSIVSETITKIISLEGIEVLINSVVVSKLNGKHSLKLKIDEKSTDLQIFFGSHVFSIISAKQLETLIEMFETGDQLPPQMTQMTGEQKLMSSEDYLKVEQQLQIDSGCAKSTPSAVISSSSVTMDSNKWTSCGLIDIEDEPQFLPLKRLVEEKENLKNKKTKKSEFCCHLRIPGLSVCLISGDQMPALEGMPIIETQNSFIRINQFLDKVLEDFNHIRFLSLHLLFDINSDSFSFTCGDLMVGEVLSKRLTPIVWSNRLNSQSIVSPFLRFKSKDNKMLLTMDSMNLRLDPTFMERIDNYFDFNSKQNNSQTNSEFNLDINCDDIKVELLFPIPDLRAHEERTYSELRKESILIKLINSSVHLNSNGGQIECKEFGIDFKMSEQYMNIINGHSVDSQVICLKYRIGLSPMTATLTEADVNQLFDAEMEDSIYVGQTAPQQVTEPFQVKRKVIGRDANENEQVLTPGDREHLNKYMDSANTSTQLSFDLFVPSVDIHFQHKEQFELLYNRIANDLILWNPFTEQPLKPNAETEQTIAQNTPFFNCKTMTDSGSTNSSFHSFMGSNQTNRLNLMTFVFNINDITFEMRTNDDKTHQLFGQNLMVGIVVGDKSESSSTVCLCCENLSLKSDGAVIISGNIYSEPNCAFSLALDIKRETDFLKKIKVALLLSSAAMYEIQIHVFKQLWEFINVSDEVVIGYTPPKVITELHIDLLDSAIALETLTTRPVLITFEDIYLTSMVVENTNQTLLRIFAEETLFCFKRNKTGAECMKNYICCIQTGIIDLNLKLSKDSKLEFKVSNNAIDVRVCADSLSALCQLIGSLTSSSVNTIDIESTPTESPPFEKTFDGKLMEDAMGDNDDESIGSANEDSDEEPPKFCTNCESPQMDESGFWVLGDDDLGTGIKMTSEPQIRVLTDDPIITIENHFNISRQRLIPDISSATICRYFLEEMTLILHLFDGKDFDDDIPTDSPVDKRTEDSKSYKSYKSNKSYYSSEPRVRFADNSVHIWENIDLVSAPNSLRGSNSNHSLGASNSFKCMGGLKRQTDTCVVIHLNKVKTLFENFEPDYPISWRFLFMVQDFEIIDRVIASKIKKMLYEYCSESMPRRKHTNMASIKATAFRNADNKEESELKISLKPLRVNVDQDTLLFLWQFFTTVVANLSTEDTELALNAMVDNNPMVDNPEDMMTFDDSASNASNVTETTVTSSGSGATTVRSASNGSKVFFRLLTFAPDVPIRLDYHGKHVDFDRGALQGLFLGLGQLNQSELRLKRLYNKHGLLGFDKVLSYVMSEWTKDIKRNQLPSLLGGVGPMHSFIQLFQGFRDLIWMPIDQYRRDRRLVRGLQRGAHSFSSSTAMATLDLANRFVSLIQSAAQFAHDVVTPPTPGHRQSMAIMTAQPRDLREGMAVAYAVMREGIHDAVREVATAGMAAEDMSGAIGGVVRHIPSTFITGPIMTAAQATSNMLVGMRNQLTPEARRDDHEKWKNASER